MILHVFINNKQYWLFFFFNFIQLFSASLDGTILVWDFQEGVVLKVVTSNSLKLYDCLNESVLIDH